MDTNDPQSKQERLNKAYENFKRIFEFYDNGRSSANDVVKDCVNSYVTVSKQEGKSSADDYVYTMWNALLDQVTNISQPQDSNYTSFGRKIDFCERYAKVLDGIYRGSELFPDLDESLTSELAAFPSLGIVVRDRFNPPSAGADSKAIDRWTQLNGFLATMWTRCNTPSATDFSQPEQFCYDIYSIWSLRDALETEQNPQMVKVLLPAAGIWIQVAGDLIARDTRQWAPSKKTGAPAKPGTLFAATLKNQESSEVEGQNGFSSVRWGFWKSRSEELANDTKVDDGTKELAKGMIDWMNPKDS